MPVYPVRKPATYGRDDISKDPRPQDGALNPKFSKPKTEIPKQVRDDKKARTEPLCHAELVSASGLLFSAFSRHTFHPRPQDGVFRCDFNNILIPYRKDRVKAPVFSNRVYSKERRGDLKRFLILF